MHGSPIPARHMDAPGLRGRLSFILTLWMALATAVICAITPAGLPATRTIGSAFDPSTTIVALRTKPPVTAKTTILRSDDRDGSGAGLGDRDRPLLPAAAPTAVTDAVAVAAAPIFIAASLLLAPRTIAFALRARPPPTY